MWSENLNSVAMPLCHFNGLKIYVHYFEIALSFSIHYIHFTAYESHLKTKVYSMQYHIISYQLHFNQQGCQYQGC